MSSLADDTEQTTASEIAARAGVTERTFFRHFADKREVLFDGQGKLRTALTDAIAEGSTTLRPLETLYRAFRSVAPLLEDNRPFSLPRQQVIAGSPALQELRRGGKKDLGTTCLDGLAHARASEG